MVYAKWSFCSKNKKHIYKNFASFEFLYRWEKCSVKGKSKLIPVLLKIFYLNFKSSLTLNFLVFLYLYEKMSWVSVIITCVFVLSFSFMLKIELGNFQVTYFNVNMKQNSTYPTYGKLVFFQLSLLKTKFRLVYDKKL